MRRLPGVSQVKWRSGKRTLARWMCASLLVGECSSSHDEHVAPLRPSRQSRCRVSETDRGRGTQVPGREDVAGLPDSVLQLAPKRLSSTAGSHAGDRLAALPLLMEQAIDPIEVRVAGSERQAILDADSGYPEVIVWDHTACGT